MSSIKGLLLALVAILPVLAGPATAVEDLSTWTVFDAPWGGTMANWTFNPDGTEADQVENNSASPTWLLAGNSSPSYRVTGYMMGRDEDYDFMGFSFCYASHEFCYVFDWRSGLDPWWGCESRNGMTVRMFTGGTTSEMHWCNDRDYPGSMQRIAQDTSVPPWTRFTWYKFTLDICPGHCWILIEQETGEDIWAVDFDLDPSLPGDGQFGLYTHSQTASFRDVTISSDGPKSWIGESGAGGSGSWDTDTNWEPYGVPASINDVMITGPEDSVVISADLPDMSRRCATLTLGGLDGTSTLDIGYNGSGLTYKLLLGLPSTIGANGVLSLSGNAWVLPENGLMNSGTIVATDHGNYISVSSPPFINSGTMSIRAIMGATSITSRLDLNGTLQNYGVIELTDAASVGVPELNIPGVLLNMPGGEIRAFASDAMYLDDRYLAAELHNRGLLTMDLPGYNLALSRIAATHLNYGTMTIVDGTMMLVEQGADGGLLNYGNLDIGDVGPVARTTEASFAKLQIGGANFRQLEGRTRIGTGDTLQVEPGYEIIVEGGRILGTGSLIGTVNQTGGFIAPGLSPGRLTIDGDYTQVAGGTLEIEIGETIASPHDTLVVTGHAALSGTLALKTLGMTLPGQAEALQVITCGSRSGEFSQVTINGMPAEGLLSVVYGESGLTLTDFSSLTAVDPNRDSDPQWEYALHPAVPNPFNPMTTLRFDLPAATTVDLLVYDVTGRLIRSLLRAERVGAGSHEIPWNGRDDGGRRVPAGVYFCRLEAGDFGTTQRITLLK